MLVEMLACASLFGQPVAYVGLSKPEFEAASARLGEYFFMAFTLPSALAPRIVYDRDGMASMSPAFQRQILAHECAHASKGIRDEDEADCEAAKRLKSEFGYGAAELDVIRADARRVLEAESIEPALVEGKLRAVAACF